MVTSPNVVSPVPLIVAADHPSLFGAGDRFVEDLHGEHRYVERSGSSTPTPVPSLVDKLMNRGAIRSAAVVDGRIVAMASVHDDGETCVAVVPDWRGHGLASALMRAVSDQARRGGHSRIFIPSSHRSRAAEALGDALAATVVDTGRGRVDLIFHLGSDARSA